MMEEENIDFEEQKKQFISFYKRLTVKDLVIIVMILLLLLMYIVHTNDIAACNAFFNELLENKTGQYLWNLTL